MVPLRVCHRLRGLPSLLLRLPLPTIITVTMAAPQSGSKTLRPTISSSRNSPTHSLTPSSSSRAPHFLSDLSPSAALSPASPAGPPQPKRFRTMATDAAAPPASSAGCSAMRAEFARHTEYLNTLNDKRERLVKASRDVTMNSKKVIFQVHRISRNNKEEVLSKAENDLAAVVNQHIGKLVKELQGTDFWKLRRAYTFGVQEYIEAATFCRFCKTGTLLSLHEINDSLLALSDKSVEPLQINVLDYLLGVADLSGELMRLAIGRISDGEVEYAKDICSFVRDIYRELTLIVPLMDDNNEMKKKMEVMLQSVVKIENACFGVHVRGSEYIPMLGSSADPDYTFLGAADYD